MQHTTSSHCSGLRAAVADIVDLWETVSRSLTERRYKRRDTAAYTGRRLRTAATSTLLQPGLRHKAADATQRREPRHSPIAMVEPTNASEDRSPDGVTNQRRSANNEFVTFLDGYGGALVTPGTSAPTAASRPAASGPPQRQTAMWSLAKLRQEANWHVGADRRIPGDQRTSVQEPRH
jgi:hypothetical protein